MDITQPIPILFYVPYSKTFTGAPRVFLNLIDRLDRTQFRPICVAHREGRLTAALRDRQLDILIVPLPPILDVENEGVFAYSWTDKLLSFKALLDYNRQIEGIGRQYGVRGIWGRNVKTVLFVGLAARNLGVPLVWDIGMEKPSRGLMRLLHWIGLSLATVVVTQAESQPREIFDRMALRQFSRKFMTISPGTGLDRIASVLSQRSTEDTRSQSPAPFTILNVGTIQPRKNQFLLLQAIEPLVYRYPQLRVQIAGTPTDEDYFAQCQQFVQIAGLSPFVTFLGWRDDIPDLMRQSDLLVLCSQNEGIPYVIREAMHAALPIVATAVGGVPEAITDGETGFLIAPNDAIHLRQAIEHCLLNPEHCEAIGQRAREAAQQKFSIAGWSSRYNDLLRQLCQV